MSDASMNSSSSASEPVPRSSGTTQTVVLGGGCFWCTEAVYVRVRGVLDVESGYANGPGPKPTYEQVCTGRTGYVEVVRLTFDPAVITLREILEIFFIVHDPHTLNRQGNDVGTQYRSGIYTSDEEQARTARAVIAEVASQAKAGAPPVVTEVEPLGHYFPAEAYHQDYFEQHPGQGYCSMVVAPKVEKFRKTFSQFSKDS
jgi:peptide-methionine (S)-S-oxide reductase